MAARSRTNARSAQSSSVVPLRRQDKWSSLISSGAVERVEQAVEEAEQERAVVNSIERATRPATRSSQPRFYAKTERAYQALSSWLQLANMEQPAYKSDTRKRDMWLRDFWMRESHLAGVLNTVVAIDKNRGWTLVGGRNQVKRYRDMLLFWVEDGAGWRTYCSMAAQSYYTADIGSITEVDRQGDDDGPARNLYFVDPTRCRVTGNSEFPLTYYPTDTTTLLPSSSLPKRLPVGKQRNPRKPQLEINWTRNDFLRAVSLPSTDERMQRVGYCAVSRCINFAQMMYAVFSHDQEMLGARMPRGILLLNNIDEDQWDSALRSRSAQLDGLESQWFGNVMVLANSSMDQADIKLVALSQLPAEFQRKEFIAYTMAGMALVFGYDPAEVWPVETGGLGRSEETKAQHRKASGKGARDFALAHQQGIQSVLPPALTFEYEERDAEGLQFDANLQMTRTDIITKIYQTGLQMGNPLITWDEARMLLADEGVIPVDWTESINDAAADDSQPTRLKRLREQYITSDRIVRSCEQFPDEPIVRYNSRTGREVVLWSRGRDMLKRNGVQGVTLPAIPPLCARAEISTYLERALTNAVTGYLSGDLTFAQGRRRFIAALDEAYARVNNANLTDNADDPLRGGRSPLYPDQLFPEHAFYAQLGAEIAAADKLWDDLTRYRTEGDDGVAVALTRTRLYVKPIQALEMVEVA